LNARLLTETELAQHLAVSPDTVRRLRYQGLPHVRLGKRLVRYPAVQVAEWIEQHIRHEPEPAEVAEAMLVSLEREP
jgi:excisionase family DNA binding protein